MGGKKKPTNIYIYINELTNKQIYKAKNISKSLEENRCTK